jgi:hypothetical protein
MVSNLALLCLANVFATFQKIGRIFPNHLVTLVIILNVITVNEVAPFISVHLSNNRVS